MTSPSEVSRALGVRLGDATYHTRVLRDLGFVELVRTAKVRGARQHFYRATVRPWLDDEAAAAVPAEARGAILSGVVADIWADLNASATAAVLNRADVHVSRTLLRLDRMGWAELSARLTALIEDALRLESESAARLERDPAAAEPPSELALFHFARAEDPDRAG